MKIDFNLTAIHYETPEVQEILQELTCLICLSDGEHEGTGEEDWGFNS